jgi:hypothetical protein
VPVQWPPLPEAEPRLEGLRWREHPLLRARAAEVHQPQALSLL